LETSIECLFIGLSIYSLVVGVRRIQGESVRQVGLVDISCCNIFLAVPDLIEVGIPRLVRMKSLLIEGGEILEGHRPSAQSGFPLGQTIYTLVIEFLARLSQKPFHGREKDKLQTISLMVNDGDDVIQTELQIGKLQIVFGQGRKYFEFTHEIITQVADRSAPKRGQAWKRRYRGVVEEATEAAKGIL